MFNPIISLCCNYSYQKYLFSALPKRNHVYHITFPPEWKTIDIINIFNPFSKFHNFLGNVNLFNIFFLFLANVYIKYINDISAWVALKDESQAKAMNKILPKLQTIHKNIILLPWSVYYNHKNTTASKRKIEECSSSPPADNLDSSIIKDECVVGQTPEKVARLSKG